MPHPLDTHNALLARHARRYPLRTFSLTVGTRKPNSPLRRKQTVTFQNSGTRRASITVRNVEWTGVERGERKGEVRVTEGAEQWDVETPCR